MGNKERKQVSWIQYLTIKPCEQSPAKLAKNITEIMHDLIVFDEGIDDQIRVRIELLGDVLRPVLDAVEKNEEHYTELLKNEI